MSLLSEREYDERCFGGGVVEFFMGFILLLDEGMEERRGEVRLGRVNLYDELREARA